MTALTIVYDRARIEELATGEWANNAGWLADFDIDDRGKGY